MAIHKAKRQKVSPVEKIILDTLASQDMYALLTQVGLAVWTPNFCVVADNDAMSFQFPLEEGVFVKVERNMKSFDDNISNFGRVNGERWLAALSARYAPIVVPTPHLYEVSQHEVLRLFMQPGELDGVWTRDDKLRYYHKDIRRVSTEYAFELVEDSVADIIRMSSLSGTIELMINTVELIQD